MAIILNFDILARGLMLICSTIHQQVFGYHHPRTQRCRNCLAEGRYVYVKQQLEARANSGEAPPQDNADFSGEDDEDSDEY